MTKQTVSKLLDSSVWLAYYFGESQLSKEIIESDCPLVFSIVSLYEIQRKLTKLGYSPKVTDEFLEFIQHRATLLSLTPPICALATTLSLKHKLGAMDSLILSTAYIEGHTLLTGDLDFKGLRDVDLIS